MKTSTIIISRIIAAVAFAAVTAASCLGGRYVGQKYEETQQEQILPAPELLMAETIKDEPSSFFDPEDKKSPAQLSAEYYADLEAVTKRNGKLSSDFTAEVNGCRVTALRDTNAEMVKQLLSDIEKLDSNMTKAIPTVVMTSEVLADKFGIDVTGKAIYGLTTHTVIYLNDMIYRDYVLIHEAFHNIDYYSGDHNGPFCYSEDYTAFYNEYVLPNDFPPCGCSYITVYEPEEYFAAMGQVWYMDPGWLKKKDPVVYEYYESHFGQIFQNRSTDWELMSINYNKYTGKWETEPDDPLSN